MLCVMALLTRAGAYEVEADCGGDTPFMYGPKP